VTGVAWAEGVPVQHVKPHGALFNMAVRNAELAAAIARAVAAINPKLILFGLPGSEILKAGRAAGLRVAAEVFADRAYEPDGSLASRRKPGSVIHDPATVVARAVRMAKERTVVAVDGSIVSLEADTMCLHGDTPGSDDLAAKIRAGLEAAGVTVKAIGSA
jgi:5-oxoprolinase (ATP-hydrolysing) subunit A